MGKRIRRAMLAFGFAGPLAVAGVQGMGVPSASAHTCAYALGVGYQAVPNGWYVSGAINGLSNVIGGQYQQDVGGGAQGSTNWYTAISWNNPTETIAARNVSGGTLWTTGWLIISTGWTHC